jgi:hypothetical protein
MPNVYSDLDGVPHPPELHKFWEDATAERVARRDEIRELCRSGDLTEAQKLALLEAYLAL